MRCLTAAVALMSVAPWVLAQEPAPVPKQPTEVVTSPPAKGPPVVQQKERQVADAERRAIREKEIQAKRDEVEELGRLKALVTQAHEIKSLKSQLRELQGEERAALEKKIQARSLQVVQMMQEIQLTDVKVRDRLVAVEKEVLGRAQGARPLILHDDYRTALDRLDAARGTLRSTAKMEEAMRAIDDATKALMNARAALWTAQDKAKATKDEAKPVKN